MGSQVVCNYRQPQLQRLTRFNPTHKPPTEVAFFTTEAMKSVAVLFARSDSTYKTMSHADVYDMERDARTYDGPHPVVAHPPCRAWGRLRAFANPRPDERNLARLGVALVREFGGVLEHPAGSTLWDAQRLPKPGQRDVYGGWTLAAPQFWWGHKAEKSTWFYIVGCDPKDIPAVPIVLGDAAYVVQSRKRHDHRPHITKAEREHTPPLLAEWLVDLASRCTKTTQPTESGLFYAHKCNAFSTCNVRVS